MNGETPLDRWMDLASQTLYALLEGLAPESTTVEIDDVRQQDGLVYDPFMRHALNELYTWVEVEKATREPRHAPPDPRPFEQYHALVARWQEGEAPSRGTIRATWDICVAAYLAYLTRMDPNHRTQVPVIKSKGATLDRSSKWFIYKTYKFRIKTPQAFEFVRVLMEANGSLRGDVIRERSGIESSIEFYELKRSHLGEIMHMFPGNPGGGEYWFDPEAPGKGARPTQ